MHVECAPLARGIAVARVHAPLVQLRCARAMCPSCLHACALVALARGPLPCGMRPCCQNARVRACAKRVALQVYAH
eukprot:3088969-Lingulodinium_polyedra.AAC.1